LSKNHPTIVSSELSADVSIDYSTGILTFDKLSVRHNHTVQLMFIFQINVNSVNGYDFNALSSPVRIGPTPVPKSTVLYNMLLTFDGDYTTLASTNQLSAYAAMIYNLLTFQYGVTFSSGVSVSPGSVQFGATSYTFNFTGVAEELAALSDSEFPSGLTFKSLVVDSVTYAAKTVTVSDTTVNSFER
jgi:hypothetical protein